MLILKLEIFQNSKSQKCKLWGRPSPPPFGKSLHFNFLTVVEFGFCLSCVDGVLVGTPIPPPSLSSSPSMIISFPRITSGTKRPKHWTDGKASEEEKTVKILVSWFPEWPAGWSCAAVQASERSLGEQNSSMKEAREETSTLQSADSPGVTWATGAGNKV